MSQQSKQTASFYMSIEKKKYVDDIVSNLSKEKELDKGETLYLIVKSFSDSTKEKSNVDYSRVKPLECNFLNYQNEEWVCLELMGSSKKPVPLGNIVSDIKAKCRACFESHQIAENERKRKLLERGNLIKLADFYKEFTTLTKQGFDADCIMCKGALLDKNSMIMSRDGEMLYCPLQNMDIVKIKDTCNEVTNTETKAKGCQYLISLPHHVDFKGSDIEKKIKAILPQLEKTEDEKEN